MDRLQQYAKMSDPAEKLKLTEEQLRIADEWFARNWKTGACPVCRSKQQKNQWKAATFVIRSLVYNPHPTGIPLVERSCIYLPVFCVMCGYTMFFNAVHIGIVPPDKPSQEKTEEQLPQEKAQDAGS